MSLLSKGWSNVTPNFSGSNQAMANSTKAFSSAGTIFDQLATRLETEKQNDITNQLNADKFEETVNQNRINNQIAQDNLAIQQEANVREQVEFEHKQLANQEVNQVTEMLTAWVNEHKKTDGTFDQWQALGQELTKMQKLTTTAESAEAVYKISQDLMSGQTDLTKALNTRTSNSLKGREQQLDQLNAYGTVQGILGDITNEDQRAEAIDFVTMMREEGLPETAIVSFLEENAHLDEKDKRTFKINETFNGKVPTSGTRMKGGYVRDENNLANTETRQKFAATEGLQERTGMSEKELTELAAGLSDFYTYEDLNHILDTVAKSGWFTGNENQLKKLRNYMGNNAKLTGDGALGKNIFFAQTLVQRQRSNPKATDLFTPDEIAWMKKNHSELLLPSMDIKTDTPTPTPSLADIPQNNTQSSTSNLATIQLPETLQGAGNTLGTLVDAITTSNKNTPNTVIGYSGATLTEDTIRSENERNPINILDISNALRTGKFNGAPLSEFDLRRMLVANEDIITDAQEQLIEPGVTAQEITQLQNTLSNAFKTGKKLQTKLNDF